MKAVTPNLHLDGVAIFKGTLERYGVNGTETCLKTEILCRIFAVVQAVLALVFTAIKQAVRGVTFLIGGILSFDFGRIKFAFKDFVSIIVQAVVLPVLGVIATFTPGKAHSLANWLVSENYCDESSIMKTSDDALEFKTLLLQPIEGKTGFVAKLFVHLTAPIQAIAHFVHAFVSSLLALKFDLDMLAFPLVLVVAPLYAAFQCNWKDRDSASKVHGFIEVN